MAFTSSQKRYIKKNYRQLTIKQIADDIGIPTKDVENYIKNHFAHYYKNHIGPTHKNRDAVRLSEIFSHDNKRFFIALLGLILIVYMNSLKNDFLSDDLPSIVQNPDLNNFSFVVTNYIGMLRNLIYWLALHIGGGMNPIFFRLANIAFHAGSAILVFILACRFTNKRLPSIAASLIFAVHPILTESIVWISGGTYSQYSFFFLLAFYYYININEQKKYIYFSLGAFVLSLLSADKAITFPLVLLLYELSFRTLKQHWKQLVPFFLLNGFMLLVYLGKIGTRLVALQSDYYQGGTGFHNPLNQLPIALSTYLKLMIWPQKLSLYQTDLDSSVPAYIMSLIIFIALLAAIVYAYKKNRAIFFWLCFLIITLSPTLTPLKISWIVAERYVYLGSIGIFITFGILWDTFAQYERFKKIAPAALALIIAALAIRTMVRNTDWKNQDTLWVATAKTSPSGHVIHNNLGDMHARHQEYGKAIEEFQKATQINPNYADAYHNLANTYQMMQQYDKAVEHYQKALSINPRIWQSYSALAEVSIKQNDPQKALEYIKKALEIQPNDPQLQQAIKTIEQSMLQQPTPGPANPGPKE